MTTRLRALALAVIALLGGCTASELDGRVASTTGSRPSCVAPEIACEGGCVDIASDPRHCGACGDSCPAGDDCVEGACATTGCPAEHVLCDGLCVHLETNPLNCGSCGAGCVPPERCAHGACLCEPPARRCDDVCTDLATSPVHCGACDAPCAPDEACVEGRCEPRCQAPLTWCGDVCADLASDATACGACGAACLQGEICESGVCVCPEVVGFARCGDECVDLASNGEHCGACGTPCPADTHCAGGTCTSCVGDFFFCPSDEGDPMQTCLAQASSAEVLLDGGPDPTAEPFPIDLACQCEHCLVELADCVSDDQCVSTWECAVQNGCTEPCWDTMGVCTTRQITGTGCFKWCSGTITFGSTQSATRTEALLRCTQANGCGL